MSFFRRLCWVFFSFFLLTAQVQAKLVVGVTLHPYYSFVANIIKDKGEIVPLIPEGFNPHAFEPRSQDIKRINELTVLVLNDIGHDAFARKMIQASENKDVPIIQANKDVPLLSTMGLDENQRDGVINSHTFISISAAMLQVNHIAKELAKLDPANADFYRENARAYNKRLRQLRSDALSRVQGVKNPNLRIATVHAAYDYLFREFGLEVSAVVEPGHAIEPGPAHVKKVIDLIKAKNISVLFTEKDNPNAYIRTIAKEANIKLADLTHMTHGAYTAQHFEEGMAYNLDQVVKAILESQ